jgi:hypothetical protein
MRALQSLDRYALSCIIILSSLWAAWVLATPPGNFATFPASFKYAAIFHLSEAEWSIAPLVGAMLHIAGLSIRLWTDHVNAARFIGFVGLSLQTMFWLYMGLSTMVANPDTLFGFAGAMIGVGGAWRLGRYGWSPDV